MLVFLSSAWLMKRRPTWYSNFLRLKGTDSSTSFPAWILEKSRMSFITVRSPIAESEMASTYSFCSGYRSVVKSSSVMPITPFMGVRISWLMLAKNSLFARLALSADFLASRNRSSVRVSSVTFVSNPL